MPKQSRLLVPRLLYYLNTNKVTVVRSWFCWASGWKSVLVMHRLLELLVIYSTLKPEKDSIKGGQEELALPQFIYKHKSIFLVLCHCRHAVRLQGPYPEPGKQGAVLLQLLLQRLKSFARWGKGTGLVFAEGCSRDRPLSILGTGRVGLGMLPVNNLRAFTFLWPVLTLSLCGRGHCCRNVFSRCQDEAPAVKPTADLTTGSPAVSPSKQHEFKNIWLVWKACVLLPMPI